MSEDPLFLDAMEALRAGDRPRAREVLTHLLKADQNNATYWIWMSAAVDTPKERIYCLQTALKFDPENATARRGLVLLDALPADENVRPFPLTPARPWEEQLVLMHATRGEKRTRLPSTLARLVGVILFLAVLGSATVYGFLLPRRPAFQFSPTHTAGPSPTFTSTPTFVNAPRSAPTRLGPTPLAVLLGVFYTPTPLYVNTPRSPLSQDVFRAARAAYNRGDWNGFLSAMQQIAQIEPEAADIPYYIGEGYRLQGDCRTALQYYNDSLRIDPRFAPAYLGLVRARLCLEPGADVASLYTLALQSDPNYGEAYLERANFNLDRNRIPSALTDLQKAEELMPESALVQLAYARAYLLQGKEAEALAAAQKANSIDRTLLPAYYILGQALILNEQYEQAIKPLELYAGYVPEDGSAYALLGQAYAFTGDYSSALEALNTALRLDPNQRQAYIYLGFSHLGLDDPDQAQYHFEKALQFYPDSFEANIGLTQTFYRKRLFGSAYLQAETSMSKVANDRQKALALYWRALSQEGRGSLRDAMRDLQTLLAMPAEVMTPEMRSEAERHLNALRTPTATPSKAGTATRTPTPTP